MGTMGLCHGLDSLNVSIMIKSLLLLKHGYCMKVKQIRLGLKGDNVR